MPQTSDTATDSDQQWSMPAEWAPHERCVLAWPTRHELWNPYYPQAKAAYAETANAIAQFEPVLMVCNPGAAAEVRASCTASVEVVELAIDDSWLRDSGPQIVLDGHGHRRGVDFAFNSWGNRWHPYDQDATISARLLDYLDIARLERAMVLEGGSITVDGEGTLITTEQCLLNPNRNPELSQAEIEAELRTYLGVERVVWLPFGHAADRHTDGHVDGVCTFVAPGVVFAQRCDDPANPDHERMAANLEVLRNSVDAAGRPFEVIEFPFYPYVAMPDGRSTMVSYANFYLANGAVVVPTAGHEFDAEALSLLAKTFPDREVVGVGGEVVSVGGGGVHCITQQIPAAIPS
ncbi:MAG: agmatine deiminase family protein [Actinomycetota bacterium]|nr:agmatine deiminase family protein [Actinomycetota bacterium]